MIKATMAALCVGITTLPPAAEAAKEIKVSLGVGPKHPAVTHGYTPYIDKVEKATAGELKFRTFIGGQLFPFRESLAGVRQNVAQVSFLVLPYWPAELPHSMMIGDMAMLGADPKAMAGAASEFSILACPECGDEFRAQNVIHLGGYSTDVFNMFGRGRIADVSDLSGKKMRVGAGGWTRWAQAFGAVPVSVAGDEIYQALSQGVVDATVAAAANIHSYNMWDVVTDLTRIPLGTFHALSLTAYNRDFWKSLSGDERQILVDHTGRAIAGVTVAFMRQSEEVVEMAPAKNLRIHTPSPELLRRTADFARKDAQFVGKEFEQKFKIENAEGKVKRFIALVRKWEALTANVGFDADALGAIYHREIFAKVNAAELGM